MSIVQIWFLSEIFVVGKAARCRCQWVHGALEIVTSLPRSVSAGPTARAWGSWSGSVTPLGTARVARRIAKAFDAFAFLPLRPIYHWAPPPEDGGLVRCVHFRLIDNRKCSFPSQSRQSRASILWCDCPGNHRHFQWLRCSRGESLCTMCRHRAVPYGVTTTAQPAHVLAAGPACLCSSS